MKKRSFALSGLRGFTLAEVLITLVIIGVIGALTVPSLIQRTNKEELASGLKKAYSTLSQAVSMAAAENGKPGGEGGWKNDAPAFYSYITKHLNILKDCGTGKGCMDYAQRVPKGGTYSAWDNFNDNYHRRFILADGMIVMVHGSGFYVDINGKKGPNTISRDVFAFTTDDDGKLIPFGCHEGAEMPEPCWNGSVSGSMASQGFNCTCKVLTEGAMNY